MRYKVEYFEEDKRKKRFVEAQNSTVLLQILQKEGIEPIRIAIVPVIVTKFLEIVHPKITMLQQIEIINNILLITKSGIPLHDGLRDFASESKNSVVTRLLIKLIAELENGFSLSQAMSSLTNSFDAAVVELVRMGEDTGQLQYTLQRAKTYLQKRETLVNSIKSALTYPVIMSSIAFIVMLVWMFVVIPQLSEMFTNFELRVEWYTQLLLDSSIFLQEYGALFFVSLVFAVVAFVVLYKKSSRVQVEFFAFLLSIGFIRRIVVNYHIANMMQYLQLAIASGVPMFNAIENLEKHSSNSYFKALFGRIKAALLEGKQLSQALQEERVISAFNVRMVRMGEQSGALQSQLDEIAKQHQHEMEFSVEQITKLIEPMFLVGIGLFFIFLIIAMMGPIYEIMTKI